MLLMPINDNYKYIGVLASFLTWLAIAIVLWRQPRVPSNSISKHVAADRRGWLIFAPLATLALVLFYIFMVNWFIPKLDLSPTYEVLVTLVILLEFITTWIPDTSGWKQRVHHYTAYTAAAILPFLTLIITRSPFITTTARILTYACLVVALGIFALYLTVKTTREKHLIYQSIFFACFYIPVLVVIFTTK